MDSADLDPYLIDGSLDPQESAPKLHLDPFSRFFAESEYWYIRVTTTQTDTHTTLRATSVAIGRILLHAK